MSTVSQKYYYTEEITECVICGRQKRRRQRIMIKPELHLKTIFIQDACPEHFI